MSAPAPPCRELVIVAPNYYPAIGGGAIYYKLLAEGLVDAGLVERVEVLTEAHPGAPRRAVERDGRLVVRRPYPYRTSRAARHWSRYLLYIVENVGFLGLLLRRWQPGSVLLVHSSFHFYPNTLRWVLPLLRRMAGRQVAAVADVRDPRLPAKRFREIHAYDGVIACSRLVEDYMGADARLAGRIRHIPVLIEARPPAVSAREAILARHALSAGGYVFWSNGVSRLKNIEVALAAMRLVRRQRPDLRLVVAGRCRDWDEGFAAAEAEGLMTYLGPIDNSEVLALGAAAALVLNVSEVESVPRGTLEAVAVGAELLFPPNVPEFADACPSRVAESRDPARLARQILDAVEGRLAPLHYPLAAHRAARVLPLYADLFRELCAPDR